MAKSLIKLCKEILAPKVIVDTLRNQDSRELGADTGKAIKRFMVNEFGEKGGKELLGAMRPWIDRFYLALRKELDDEN